MAVLIRLHPAEQKPVQDACFFRPFPSSATETRALLILFVKLRLAFGCRKKQFLITKENRMDFQNGNECAAFSSAYVLRHWGIEANGTSLYERISGKRRDGTVYPAGICRLLYGYGFCTRYCTGTVSALKREVAKGNPVIVLLRTYAGKSWLHYVPVIGYDEEYIFIAESFRELVNCDEECYNRKITIEEFKRLWNTAGLKMPFYRNTYITAGITVSKIYTAQIWKGDR